MVVKGAFGCDVRRKAEGLASFEQRLAAGRVPTSADHEEVVSVKPGQRDRFLACEFVTGWQRGHQGVVKDWFGPEVVGVGFGRDQADVYTAVARLGELVVEGELANRRVTPVASRRKVSKEPFAGGETCIQMVRYSVAARSTWGRRSEEAVISVQRERRRRVGGTSATCLWRSRIFWT